MIYEMIIFLSSFWLYIFFVNSKLMKEDWSCARCKNIICWKNWYIGILECPNDDMKFFEVGTLKDPLKFSSRYPDYQFVNS